MPKWRRNTRLHKTREASFRFHSVEAGVFGPEDLARASLDQAWNAVPPERRRSHRRPSLCGLVGIALAFIPVRGAIVLGVDQRRDAADILRDANDCDRPPAAEAPALHSRGGLDGTQARRNAPGLSSRAPASGMATQIVRTASRRPGSTPIA